MHRPAPAARPLFPLKGRLRADGATAGGHGPGKGAKIAAGIVAAIAFLWVIAIFTPIAHPRDLQVTGATGGSAGEIRTAIEDAARGQSTFRVSKDDLMAAVASYPEVAEIKVDAQPPFRLDLTVVMRPPVGRAQIGGRVFTVAGDGTVLQRADEAAVPKLDHSLGSLLLRDGHLVGDGGALRVLGAAPEQLLDLIRVLRRGEAGLEIELQRGPRLIFGNADNAASKWAAATAVLAEGSAVRATYVDVRVPGRPAVGGLGGSKTAAAADAPPTLTAQTPEAAATVAPSAGASQSGASATGATSGASGSTGSATPQGQAGGATAPTPSTSTQTAPQSDSGTSASATAGAADTQTPPPATGTGGAAAGGIAP